MLAAVASHFDGRRAVARARCGQRSSLRNRPQIFEVPSPNEDYRFRDGGAVGYYDHNVLTIHDCSAKYRTENSVETFWKVRAEQVILAAGAIEQPLLFANNDLPGIMLAGAMREYLQRYAVECGRMR